MGLASVVCWGFGGSWCCWVTQLTPNSSSPVHPKAEGKPMAGLNEVSQAKFPVI